MLFATCAGMGYSAVVVQADGRIVAAGPFSCQGGGGPGYLVRLNPDGSLDAAFQASANGEVTSMLLQVDGRIVVGGAFTQLGGEEHRRIGRLHPDGSVDSSFALHADRDVFALAMDREGGILVGGEFNFLGGQRRNLIARLLNTHPATDELIREGGTLTWLRGGGGPKVERALFDYSTDGLDWVRLGAGSRIAEGWQLVGASPPEEAIIRVQGLVRGGRYNGSSSWIGGYQGRPLLIWSQPQPRRDWKAGVERPAAVNHGD